MLVLLRTPIVRFTAAGLLSAIAIVADPVATQVGAAQPEVVECEADSPHPAVGGDALIECVYSAGADASRRGISLALEFLEGSVNDRDGTTPPADLEQQTETRLVTFVLSSRVPGSDAVCIWLKPDDPDRAESAGLLDCRSDDDDTEFVHVGWVQPASSTPRAASSPVTDAVASEPTPSARPARAKSAATTEEDDAPGFVLVADHELSLAFDALLVALAAVVLWRSRWVRAVVVESVRHPRTPTWIDRDGTGPVDRDLSAPSDERET